MHEALRTTPAVALGIADRRWTIAEGLHLADSFVEIESGKGADVPSIAIWWLRGGSLGVLERSPF
jgi:hypothetical protein